MEERCGPAAEHVRFEKPVACCITGDCGLTFDRRTGVKDVTPAWTIGARGACVAAEGAGRVLRSVAEVNVALTVIREASCSEPSMPDRDRRMDLSRPYANVPSSPPFTVADGRDIARILRQVVESATLKNLTVQW